MNINQWSYLVPAIEFTLHHAKMKFRRAKLGSRAARVIARISWHELRPRQSAFTGQRDTSSVAQLLAATGEAIQEPQNQWKNRVTLWLFVESKTDETDEES